MKRPDWAEIAIKAEGKPELQLEGKTPVTFETEEPDWTEGVVTNDTQRNFERWKRERWRSTAAEEKTRQRNAFPVALLSNSIRSIGATDRSKENEARFLPEVELASASANAMKVALLAVFWIRAFGKGDKSFRTVVLTVPQLLAGIGLGYRLTSAQVKRLLVKAISTAFIIKSASRFMVLGVLSICELDSATGLVRLRLNADLEPFLLRLENKFFRISPRIMKLRSARAINLYLLLRRWAWMKRCRTSLKELRSVLHLPKAMPWWIFQRDILEPSLREINSVTDIRAVHKPEREGERGKVQAVHFQIGKRLLLKPKCKKKVPLLENPDRTW
jgi:hypothetical protein